jgi:hypothetical protein
MASESTIKIQDSITYVQRFLRNRPLAIGDSLEPALTAANLVKSTIQGPPFRWRWNRSVIQFLCHASVPVQDYSEAISNFGFIESAAVQDPDTLAWSPLEVKIGLELESAQGRPEFISAQLDDENGNITFRLMPVPDKDYAISITAQEQDPLFSSLNQTWGIPDEYMQIFTWGFTALMGLFAGNLTLYQLGNAKFVSSLLAAQQGLDQTQVNVFLNNWQAVTGQPQAQVAAQNQGGTSRGI